MSYLKFDWQADWEPLFKSVKSELQIIDKALEKRANSGETIYPFVDDIFRAFKLTSLSNVKVVIVGQDPYHGEGEAEGLAFSVPDSCKRPPSLRNIYKEMAEDLQTPIPVSNSLVPWAKEGVLLLNAMLTVAKDSAGAHQKIGWQEVTDRLIKRVSDEAAPVVFVLWGKFAEKKRVLIDESKHRVIISAHPSPLSARRGFFGSRPFSKVNSLLSELGRETVNWSLA